MLARNVSCSSVLLNIRSLPTAQLSLPAAQYLLQLVLNTSSCLLVIKSTLPLVAVACWVLFIALPASRYSTVLIFIALRLLHISCLLAVDRFQLATCCSFIVLRCPLSIAPLLRFDSCFSLVGSFFSYLTARCSLLSAFRMLCSLVLTRYSWVTCCLLLSSKPLFTGIISKLFIVNRHRLPTSRLSCSLLANI